MKAMICITMCLGLLSMISIAEEAPAVKIVLPKHYPAQFENRDLVYDVGVNGQGAYINVGGNEYAIDSGAVIHLLDQGYGSVKQLKAGMGVGYKLIQVGNGTKIGTIWLLPPEMTPPPS